MYNVLIAGGRDFSNYVSLKKKCDEILKDVKDDISIISGKANGADSLGEKYADEKGYSVQEFPAKWNDLTAIPCKIKTNSYGRQYNALAGFNRNKDMVDVADIVIVFWDGKSSGTNDTIDYARSKNIKLIIVNY